VVRVVHLDDVEGATAGVLRLAANTLQNKDRTRSSSYPRMLAMYLARKHTRATYTQIGQRFGGRNHSTAVSAEKKVRLWVEQDRHLALGEREVRVRDVIERIEQELLK
jgi:chromosomal replication initiator protein